MPDALRARIGLVLGPIILVLMLLAPAPPGLPAAAWRTAALALLMAIWWITEAIPLAATALLPLALVPLLGIAPISEATAPYANPVIYLFLGGFLIAAALEQCGLHRRMALVILAVFGTRPANVILGFMVATAFISMWVSNTATVVMLLPMVLAVIHRADATGDDGSTERRPHFAPALLLGVSYAASIGGLGTIIGTPPNALFVAFVADSYGIRIGFAQWMVFAMPIVILTIPIAWWLLTRILHRVGTAPLEGGGALLLQERRALGPLSRTEWTVGIVTVLAALGWITQPILETHISGLSDTGIAICAALLLFVLPISWRPLRCTLEWRHAERLPWSVLILFGGGLSLAAAIQGSGLADWVGTRLHLLAGWPDLAVILAVVVVVIILSELASNTAVAAAFLPVVASLATATDMNPLTLALACALAASTAFMLPVATPPNTLVYGTGRLSVAQMATAGFWLNLLFVVALPLAVLLLGHRLLSP